MFFFRMRQTKFQRQHIVETHEFFTLFLEQITPFWLELKTCNKNPSQSLFPVS
ncbi:unnamed protein product [Tenebrio molitor]|nr:unnamed protein product [Tenebrio molitor]